MIPKRLIEELTRWIEQKKYGEISIKFNAGNIVHMTRTESLKVVFTPVDTDTKLSIKAITTTDDIA